MSRSWWCAVSESVFYSKWTVITRDSWKDPNVSPSVVMMDWYLDLIFLSFWVKSLLSLSTSFFEFCVDRSTVVLYWWKWAELLYDPSVIEFSLQWKQNEIFESRAQKQIDWNNTRCTKSSFNPEPFLRKRKTLFPSFLLCSIRTSNEIQKNKLTDEQKDMWS